MHLNKRNLIVDQESLHMKNIRKKKEKTELQAQKGVADSSTIMISA